MIEPDPVKRRTNDSEKGRKFTKAVNQRRRAWKAFIAKYKAKTKVSG